ncbi:uncharacterized protein LOC134694010 isoform X2 [Mytilus trossulus]|uniref:uncharacterized protein LOC134694010 isoform X2 n=1 Tax=Mytilus trossulus TaxID=6551 RepID=UPI003004783D
MVDRFSNQLAQSSVHRVKTVIIGDFNVGKTSVALRFTRDQFKEKYQSTIAASFFANSLDFNGEKIAFQIWDTAGQERYRSLIPMYLRGSEAAIIVYDITSKASFKGVHFWLGFLRDNGPQGLKIAIIGNKLDLEASREVSEKEVESFCDEEKIYFMEVSAKTGDNVQRLFTDIAKSILSGDKTQRRSILRQSSIKIDTSTDKHKHRCCHRGEYTVQKE